MKFKESSFQDVNKTLTCLQYYPNHHHHPSSVSTCLNPKRHPPQLDFFFFLNVSNILYFSQGQNMFYTSL